MRFLSGLGIVALAHASSIAVDKPDASLDWHKDFRLISRYRRAISSNRPKDEILGEFSEEEKARMRALRKSGIADFSERATKIREPLTSRKEKEIYQALENFVDVDNNVTSMFEPPSQDVVPTMIHRSEFRSVDSFLKEILPTDTSVEWRDPHVREGQLAEIEAMDPNEFDTLCKWFRLGSARFMELSKAGGFVSGKAVMRPMKEIVKRLDGVFKAYIQTCEKLELTIHV